MSTSRSSPLWSRAELAAALGVEVASGADVTGVSIDSRTAEPGDLFVALSGAADPRYHGAGGSGRDGHDFVAAAAAAGAAAGLVARASAAALTEIVVEDPFAALWILARAARTRLDADAPVFAITGSSGKTTAKSMLDCGLSAQLDAVHAATGSLNNHLGVPLSLARMPRSTAAAVFEIGTNSPGEIAPLSELVAPDVALLLNVLPVHLEGLGNLDGVRREKLGIARGLTRAGTLLIPEDLDVDDDPVAEAAHQGRVRILRFGRSGAADIRLHDGASGVRVEFPDGHCVEHAELAWGPHRRITACAVLGAIWAAGLEPAAAVAAIAADLPPQGRGRLAIHDGVAVIDDSYNANPESVRQALAGLRELPADKRHALLGDMLELGARERELHAELADACVGIDRVYCVGPLSRELFATLTPEQRGGWWPDVAALDLELVADALAPGDALLVKGSNRIFWQDGTVARIQAVLDERAAVGGDSR